MDKTELEKLADSFEENVIHRSFNEKRVPKTSLSYEAYLIEFINGVGAVQHQRVGALLKVIEFIITRKKEQELEKVEKSINNLE